MADYAFIDQHLHTIFSDEELCDETPEHILGKVQAYVEKYNRINNTNAKCLISFADHNTILSSVEAQRLLRTGKYPNVEYVNGCEFTIDLTELSKFYDGKKLFTRCHMHGFNYDEKNPELIAYSKITHLHFTKEDNLGLQICAGRRAISEELGITVPFTALEPLASMGQYSNFKQEFLDLFTEYCRNNKIKFNRNDVMNILNEYIVQTPEKYKGDYRYQVTYNPSACGMGRLKLSEAVRMVKKAGGQVVFAHPGLISANVSLIPKVVKKHGGDERQALLEINTSNKKNKKTMELIRCHYAKLLLNELLDGAEQVCGTKIDGLETYYSMNFINRFDKIVHETCRSRKMFETCGSDYHGEHFPTHKTIGSVFQHGVQNQYIKNEGILKARELFIRVANISGADYFVSRIPVSDVSHAKFINDKGKVIEWGKLDEIIDDINKINVKSMAEKATPFETENPTNTIKATFEERIRNLVHVEEMFDEILERMSEHRDYTKVMLRLDKFAKNIYNGIQNIEKIVRNASDIIDPELYKQVVTLTKHIHSKYLKVLEKDPKFVSRLQKQLGKRYGKNKTYIDKIATITIKEKEKGE